MNVRHQQPFRGNADTARGIAPSPVARALALPTLETNGAVAKNGARPGCLRSQSDRLGLAGLTAPSIVARHRWRRCFASIEPIAELVTLIAALAAVWLVSVLAWAAR